MSMIIDHPKPSTNLRQKFTAIYRFFASQRSVSYALAQENRHLAHEFPPIALGVSLK